jgi:hypothetical protein
MKKANNSVKVRKKELIYLPVNDPVTYFIKYKRDLVWGKNKAEWKNCFMLQLRTLKLFVDNNANEKLLNSFVYRLGLGYWGIGKQSGISSGIISEKALNQKGIKKTDDHLIGAQSIGRSVREAFELCDFNEEYMVNTWLYENLWMWMTIKVTQEEHSSKNISKTITNIEEKKMLRHYINVSPLVVLKK